MRSVAEDENVVTIFSPTLNSKTFVLYFTPMLQQVVLDHSHLQTSDPAFLDTMLKVAESWQTLTRLIRFFPTNHMMMRVALKHDCSFMEKMLKDMKFYKQQFKMHPREILHIIKQVQAGTRMLQAVCGDSKRLGRSNITSRVPRIKKLMEQFVYQVSKLFDDHKLTPFVKTSTLKNKTVEGEEIVKENTDDEEETAEEQEQEQAPPEESKKTKRKNTDNAKAAPKKPKAPKKSKEQKQKEKEEKKKEKGEKRKEKGSKKKKEKKRKKEAEDDEETEEESQPRRREEQEPEDQQEEQEEAQEEEQDEEQDEEEEQE